MADDPATVLRSYWDRVFVDRDLDAVDDLVTDPSIRHTADGTRRFTHAELKSYLADALAALRTEQVTFEALTVDGPDAWLRATITGISMATHTPIKLAWIAQYRIVDGRIAEAWSLHQTNMDWTH